MTRINRRHPLRIIAGKHKGAALYGPKGLEVRPTSDRVKEALFNILAPHLEGASFLDLFAGSGAIGLEAYSREAARVVAVELAHEKLLRKNMAKLKIGPDEGFSLAARDAFAVMVQMRRDGDRFDIIYADPPWGAGMEERILASAAPLLASDGQLILEINKRTNHPDGAPYGLALADTRKYGRTALAFYQSARPDPASSVG